MKAAKDGTNTTLLVFETGNITQNLPVLSYERNQRQVQTWIQKWVKERKGFNFRLDFNKSTLQKYFTQPKKDKDEVVKAEKKPIESFGTLYGTIINCEPFKLKPVISIKGNIDKDISEDSDDSSTVSKKSIKEKLSQVNKTDKMIDMTSNLPWDHFKKSFKFENFIYEEQTLRRNIISDYICHGIIQCNQDGQSMDLDLVGILHTAIKDENMATMYIMDNHEKKLLIVQEGDQNIEEIIIFVEHTYSNCHRLTIWLGFEKCIQEIFHNTPYTTKQMLVLEPPGYVN